MKWMDSTENPVFNKQAEDNISTGMYLFLVFILSCIIGVLTLNAMYPEQGQFSSVRFAVTGAGAFIILFLNGFSVGPLWRKGLCLLFLWMTFSLASLISALVTGDNIIGELWQMCGVPLAFFLGFPRLTLRRGAEILAWGLVLGFSSYLCISLLKYPIVHSYYKGVFYNANTMGMTLVAIAAGNFAVIRGWITSQQSFWLGRFRTFGLGLFNMLVVLLIVFTSSRTSLIAFGLLFLIFIWTLLIHADKSRGWLIGIGLLSFLALIILSIGLEQGNGISFLSNVIGKFSEKPDITALSGRELIWKQVLQDASLFGHGNMYFTDIIRRLPHNAYIAVLGTKGIIASLVLVVMHLIVWGWSFQKMLVDIKQDGYAATPLFIITAYIIIGMTENVGGILGNGLHIAFLIAVGLLIQKTETQSTKLGEKNEDTIYT